MKSCRLAVLVLAKFSKVSALVVRAFGNFANHAHCIHKGEFSNNQTAPFGALNAVTSGNAPLNFSIFTSPV